MCCNRIRLGVRVAVLTALASMMFTLVMPTAAFAAVSVTRAELSGTSLRVEGQGARSGVTITVSSSESTATGRADSRGRFKVTASGFRSSTCKVTVGDGATTTVATLSQCTPGTATPASLDSLAVAPSSVTGGNGATGTVTLTGAAPPGGTTVSLSSGSGMASVPPAVTVAAGSTSATFAVTTSAVTAQASVALTATSGTLTRTATLTLLAPAPAVPALSFVALSHASLSSVGSNAVGEVRLGSVTSSPVVVTLTSSHPSIARLTLGTTTEISSVQVEPGFDQAVFLVRHVAAVTAPTVVTVTASAAGVTRSTQLTINPTPALAFFAASTDMGPGFVGSNFVDTATGIGTTLGVSGYGGVVQFDIIAGQLPAGLSLVNPGAGGATPDFPPMRSVTGVPTVVGTNTFTLRATDTSNGATAQIVVTITVNPALGIVLTPQLPWSPIVGSFSNLWITGSGGVRPYTWVRTAGQLPPGMSLVQDNPSGPLARITGTPTTTGTFTFTLRITDAQGAIGIQSFTVVVT